MISSINTLVVGDIILKTETRLFNRNEKKALVLINKGLYDWGKPGHVNIRGGDDKMDESKTVSAKACAALCEAGLLDSDPMAYHGHQYNITDLGREAARQWAGVIKANPVR